MKKDLRSLLSNSTKKISFLRQKSDFTKQKLSDTRVYNTTIEFKQKELEKVEKDLDETMKLLSTLGEIDNNLIKKLEQKLYDLQNYKEVLELQNKFEELKIQKDEKLKREKERVNSGIQKIKENLWTEDSFDTVRDALSVNNEYLIDMREYLRFQEEIEELNFQKEVLKVTKKSLERIEKDIDESSDLLRKLKIQTKLLSCPKCQTNLRLNENALVVYEDQLLGETVETISRRLLNFEKRRKEIIKTIKFHEKIQEKYKFFLSRMDSIEQKYEEILSPADIIEDIEYIKDYISDNNIREKELEVLATRKGE